MTTVVSVVLMLPAVVCVVGVVSAVNVGVPGVVVVSDVLFVKGVVMVVD